MIDLCWEYVGKCPPWTDINIPKKHFDDIISGNQDFNQFSEINQ
jgi:hypothetical protein